MKKILILFVILISLPVISQEVQGTPEKSKKINKGKMYVMWGWNRGFFSNSDIQFKGPDYDFLLHDVTAQDRIVEFSFYNYLHPGRITIPQTNFRIGYFFHDHYTVSFGVDHMKYVMDNYQTVKIDGEINNGTDFDGVYNEEDIILTEKFLTFEHTDGLNYLNIELNRFDSLNDLLNFDSGFMEVNLTEGIGGGILYPKTNTRLMNNPRYDEFNLAGYGLSAKVGLNLTFFKYFFIQNDYKVGYINMDNIRTTSSTLDGASQDFTFFEVALMFGVRFQLVNTDN